MKVDNVFANKVIRLLVTPGLPVVIEIKIVAPIAKLQKACEITDGRVKPDIKVLVVSVRDLESEIGRVA